MIEDIQLPCLKMLRMTLSDMNSEHVGEQAVKITATPLGINIMADGYGDHTSAEGHGLPIFLELYRGSLRLIVWADINQEEPTHIIDLGGAREDHRSETGE